MSMEFVESLKMSMDGASIEGVVADVKYLSVFWVNFGFSSSLVDFVGCFGTLMFRD